MKRTLFVLVIPVVVVIISSCDANHVQEKPSQKHGQNIGAKTYKPYAFRTVNDESWKDAENDINHLKRTVSDGKPNPTAHYYLGSAYNQRGMLDDAKAEFQIALSQNPQFSEARDSLSLVERKMGLIDEYLGGAERELGELVTQLSQKGITRDKRGQDVEGAISQTGSYIVTLKSIAEGKLRVYTTYDGKQGAIAVGIKTIALWRSCIYSYGAKLDLSPSENFVDKAESIIVSTPTPESPLHQVTDGMFKGAFVDEANKVVIPGLQYYRDILKAN